MRGPVPDPSGERRDRLVVAWSGSEVEDDLGAYFTVFVACWRGPAESVAEAELDHADEPDPLVAVLKRMVLHEASAKHGGLGGQIRVELEPPNEEAGACSAESASSRRDIRLI